MTLRFTSGGGRPPASHELLLIDDSGAQYLTGMPWPGQPPFDEIGAYAGDLPPTITDRLRELARACLDAPPPPPGPADAGTDSVALEGHQIRWSRSAPPEPMQQFIATARAAISELRTHPAGTVRGTLDGNTVRLTNRGDRPLELDDAGELRAGWGRSSRPPSPLRLAGRPASILQLPTVLTPGAEVQAPLPDPGASEDPEEFDMAYALVHVRWRPPDDSDTTPLDGWLVVGPHEQ